MCSINEYLRFYETVHPSITLLHPDCSGGGVAKKKNIPTEHILCSIQHPGKQVIEDVDRGRKRGGGLHEPIKRFDGALLSSPCSFSAFRVYRTVSSMQFSQDTSHSDISTPYLPSKQLVSQQFGKAASGIPDGAVAPFALHILRLRHVVSSTINNNHKTLERIDSTSIYIQNKTNHSKY